MAIASTGLLPNDGTILISDGGLLTYTIAYEDGDYSISGLRRNQKSIVVGKDRGENRWFRESEDQDLEISFSCQAIALLGDSASGGSTAMPSDVFLRLGVWAGATSTLPSSTGDVYAVKIRWTGERTNFGASADTYVECKYCTCEMAFSEGVPGKLTFKITAHKYSNDYLVIAG